MKKCLLLLCCLAMFTLLFAQDGTNRSVQEILMSKTWHRGNTLDVGVRFVFTRDSMEYYVVGAFGYDNFRGKQAYYIGKTKDASFDNKKVGKNQNGDYLIEESRGAHPNFNCKKILEINDSRIKFEFIDILNGAKGVVVYDAVK